MLKFSLHVVTYQASKNQTCHVKQKLKIVKFHFSVLNQFLTLSPALINSKLHLTLQINQKQL